MSIRAQVAQLSALGPLPDSDASEDVIAKHQAALHSITPPVSDDEARELVKLFGPDECYGLAWTLVHLIETAPGWPLRDCLAETGNDWIKHLRNAAENARLLTKKAEKK